MQHPTSGGAVVPYGTGRHINLLGHSITVILSKEATAGDYFVFEVLTPPGLGLPPHVHEREDELIHVVEGELEILLGENVFTAKTGDTVFFPRGVAHAFNNVSSKAARGIFTAAPGASFEAFVDTLAALPPGPPDIRRIVEVFARYGMEVLLPVEL
jgi:quercetin dioxygenase-like cupin family protein